MRKFAGRVANSVDLDQMLHSAASDLGLHFLHMHVCSNTQSKKDTVFDLITALCT